MSNVSSQVSHPARAGARTGVQVGVPTFFVLLGIVPGVLTDFLAQFGESLPPKVYLWLTGASVVITSMSVILARVMAIQPVDDRLGVLASQPSQDGDLE